MKKQPNQTKRLKCKLTAFKPLVLLTMLGLSTMANAAISPFASVPLHLQAESTSTVGGGVPPNVLLQIDDSGSMQWVTYANTLPGEQYWEKNGATTAFVNDPVYIKHYEVNNGWTRKTAGNDRTGVDSPRIDIAKRALNRVLANDEYMGKANFGVLTLWNNEVGAGAKQGSYQYAQAVANGQREFKMSVAELKDIVDHLNPGGGTPAVERYFDAAVLLEKAMKYRCQKSYVILFSDGDAASYFSQPTVSNNTFKWTTNGTGYFPQVNTSTFKTLLAHQNPRAYALPADMTNYLVSPPTYPSATKLWPPVFTYNRTTGTYNWNLTDASKLNSNLLESWTQHPDILPLAANMFVNDLKTTSSVPNIDAAGKSWDDETDYGGINFKTQNIQTYAVGFGAGLSEIGLRSLNGMSTANGYQSLNASTEKELDEAFAKIFSAINAQNELKIPYSTSSISPTAMMDTTSANVLSGTAAVLLDLKHSASEIRIYKMTSSGGKVPVYTVDSNNYTLPDYSTRRVLFNEGGANNKVSWLNEFVGTNATFGITNNINANEWKEALIPWLMRSRPDAEIAALPNLSQKYRVRGVTDDNLNTRNMGHILSASLEAFGDTQYNRQQYMVTAANDGMVYLFESKNSATNPYELKMNYMPAGMQRESATDTVMKYYKNLASEDYITNTTDNPHQYLLNGDFEVRTTDKGLPNRRMFMSGNMGQAGRGSYSLNLAGKSVNGTSVGINGSDWRSSVPLFETKKEANNLMGYTIGKPGIGRLSTTRTVQFTGSAETAKATMTTDMYNVYYATFVNSGVRHPNEALAGGSTESALYVYSTLGEENVGLASGSSRTSLGHTTGQLLKKLTANATGGGLAQPTLLDVNLDGIVDLAYAGDYKGNMYRFDFREGDPNKWTVNRLFTTKDNRPITSAPAVSYMDDNTYVVVFGTGSDLYQADLKNTDIQTVYGIYDFIGNQVPTATAGVGSLLKQELNKTGGTSNYSIRELTKNPINTQQQKGWYFDLLETGERVTVRPTLLLKTVLLTTTIYSVDATADNTVANKDVCAPDSTTQTTSATSWVLQFRSDTGGRLPSKGEENASHFPYVDLTGENLNSTYADRAESSLHSGIQMTGSGLANLLALVANDTGIGSLNSAYTMSGEVGDGLGSEDIELDPDGQDHQFCFNTATETGQVLVSDSSNTASGGISTSKAAFYEVCSGVSLRRISWREIF